MSVSNPPRVAKADVNENVNTKQTISTSKLAYSLQFFIGTDIRRDSSVGPGAKAKYVQDSVTTSKTSFQLSCIYEDSTRTERE